MVLVVTVTRVSHGLEGSAMSGSSGLPGGSPHRLIQLLVDSFELIDGPLGLTKAFVPFKAGFDRFQQLIRIPGLLYHTDCPGFHYGVKEGSGVTFGRDQHADHVWIHRAALAQ